MRKSRCWLDCFLSELVLIVLIMTTHYVDIVYQSIYFHCHDSWTGTVDARIFYAFQSYENMVLELSDNY